MEILQILNFIMKIWSALTTENEELVKILIILLNLVETTVSMLLFLSILNISSSKRQKITYIIVIFILSTISNLFIPKPYGTYIHMIISPIIIMLIFKINIFKSIISEIIPLIVTVLLEMIFSKICFLFFKVSYEEAANIPFTRILIVISIYISMYIIYKLSKKFNFNITLLDNFNYKNKTILRRYLP